MTKHEAHPHSPEAQESADFRHAFIAAYQAVSKTDAPLFEIHGGPDEYESRFNGSRAYEVKIAGHEGPAAGVTLVFWNEGGPGDAIFSVYHNSFEDRDEGDENGWHTAWKIFDIIKDGEVMADHLSVNYGEVDPLLKDTFDHIDAVTQASIEDKTELAAILLEISKGNFVVNPDLEFQDTVLDSVGYFHDFWERVEEKN